MAAESVRPIFLFALSALCAFSSADAASNANRLELDIHAGYPPVLGGSNIFGYETACNPHYVPFSSVQHYCTFFQGEGAWHQLSIKNPGRGVVILQPWPSAEQSLVRLRFERSPSSDAQIEVRLDLLPPQFDGDAPRQEIEGRLVIPPGTSVRFRAAFEGELQNLPTGEYRICYDLLSGDADSSHAIDRECLDFELLPPDATRNQAELLRRRAIALAAECSLDEAASVVSDLLALHPTSAVGYVLRGVIAEHQRLFDDAIRDYEHAIELYERDGDSLFDPEDPNLPRMWIRGLRTWVDLMVYAYPVGMPHVSGCVPTILPTDSSYTQLLKTFTPVP